MSSNYLDNYYGSILDPIHGDIKLSEIEKWCIFQPIFSRLRHVKQNTFLYYVFPSANHTRFEHSIGVMHIAGQIFRASKENFATGQKKANKHLDNKDSSFYDLNKIGESLEEIYYQELRLAALFHDIGHGPLSHLFDDFSINETDFLHIIFNEPILYPYYQGFKKLIKQKGNIEHEIISCAFVFVLINELKAASKVPNKFSPNIVSTINNISAERIVKLIETSFQNLDSFKGQDEKNYDSYFSSIISGFPIDADRMDYLLRDSYFSGVTYGIYDINRIFSSFLAFDDADNIKLVFKESGLDSMLRFIQSRTHLYNQVYFHKTNRSANTMLSYSTGSAKEKKVKVVKAQTVKDLMSFYVKNSDEYFLNTTIAQKIAETPNEKSVLQNLLNRRLFKRVYQEKISFFGDSVSKREEIKSIRAKMNIKLKQLENDGIIAVADYYDNITYKDLKEGKSLSIAIKNRDNKYEFKKNWNKLNLEFMASDLTVGMVRIYLKRDFKDSQEFKKRRSLIRATVASEIEKLSILNSTNQERFKAFMESLVPQ